MTFDTPIALAGPLRRPRQMLAEMLLNQATLKHSYAGYAEAG